MGVKLSELKTELESRPHVQYVSDPVEYPKTFPTDSNMKEYEFTYTMVSSTGKNSGYTKIKCTVKNEGDINLEEAAWSEGWGSIPIGMAEDYFIPGVAKLQTLTGCRDAWESLELNYSKKYMIVKALTHEIDPNNNSNLHQGIWKVYTIHNIAQGGPAGWNISEVPDGGPSSQDNYLDG